jgi:Ca2+:H+ antiporter
MRQGGGGAGVAVWSWAVPALAWALLLVVPPGAAGGLGSLVLGAALLGAVFAAVHHAEVIAHKVGEPFGTLVLALAVTVIEVALIVSVMVSAPEPKPTLARDTVFAAVMIVLNGVVGLCILIGGARYGEAGFRVRASASYLAVLVVLATSTMVLPDFTLSVPGPLYTPAQLAFASAASLVLYGVFLFVQTVRHRDYFLPAVIEAAADEGAHAAPPTPFRTLASSLLLPAALGAVVLLAKTLSGPLEAAVRAAGAPQPAAVVGVAVATLVLLPESLAAIRAARLNRLQTSLNLALGSALASIALTVPAVSAVSLWLGQPLILGLGEKELVLLAMTFLVSALTLGGGRATVLQGAVHLVVLALFLFLVVVP